MAFRAVAMVDALWRGEMRAVLIGTTRVLVVNADGVLRAYHDRCAHLGVPLSDGRLSGKVLTCGAHHWEYDVGTGCGLNPPTARLAAIPIKIEAGRLYIDIDGDA